MIKSVIVILICVTIKSRMYCQQYQYLFLTTFLIIVPFPSHGRYSSKPSPRCAVGRAYNAKAELGKVYCGAHVIGCRLTVTSNAHHLRYVVFVFIISLLYFRVKEAQWETSCPYKPSLWTTFQQKVSLHLRL